MDRPPDDCGLFVGGHALPVRTRGVDERRASDPGRYARRDRKPVCQPCDRPDWSVADLTIIVMTLWPRFPGRSPTRPAGALCVVRLPDVARP
jgi:hypothetical protein